MARARSIPASVECGRGEQDVWANVARLAVEAARRGTFGVGGVLVDERGEIVAEARNAVMSEGRLVDPTAHVERQLIEWYQSRSERPPESVPPTIASSLEPCMMCAGSILRAGMRCVSLTDDSFAGVGVRSGLTTLPPSMHARANEAFSSAAVRGERIGSGSPPAPLRTNASPEAYQSAREAFERSLDIVREAVAEGAADSWSSGDGDRRVTAQSPGVWTAEDASHAWETYPHIVAELGGDGSAAGLMDSKERLLCVAVGIAGSTTARTAVTECVRSFTAHRHRMAKLIEDDLRPQDLTLLMSGALKDDELIISLGAAGSFLESPLPANRAPFVRLVDAESSYADHVVETLNRFPPFYTSYVRLAVTSLPVR